MQICQLRPRTIASLISHAILEINILYPCIIIPMQILPVRYSNAFPFFFSFFVLLLRRCRFAIKRIAFAVHIPEGVLFKRKRKVEVFHSVYDKELRVHSFSLILHADFRPSGNNFISRVKRVNVGQ